MNSIWKFELQTGNETETEIRMPRGAKILTVQYQNGILCIWALVDLTEPPETRLFALYGTGWDFEYDPSMIYIGTVQNPPFVWHIFEHHE